MFDPVAAPGWPGRGIAWRFAALIGLAAGLAISTMARAEVGLDVGLGLGAITVAALAALAPRRPGVAAGAWLTAIALATFVAGLAAGSARLAAIDAGALHLRPGERARVRGFVVAVPRRAQGTVDVRVETAEGELMLEAPEPVPDLEVGSSVQAAGFVRAPSEFEHDYLERLGVASILEADAIEPLDRRRGGLAGLLDGIRARGERALSEGTAAPSAALLRGFVLGQDDRIDAATTNDFKRSGLAHLLAVSGQNVVLLAVLAAALLGVLGVSLRTRLILILALIAIYVPVTGAGPSIQRAGVMGAAGVIAALAGRPRSRWYALLLAAAVTLALDPRATADVGWQLSFAAVVGILVLAAPLAGLLAGPRPGPARRALAEGAALTIAATLATAPLMTQHFGTFSVVSLPANLLAAPAEAPLMWLGMLSAAAGQLSWLPTEPLTWLAGLLAGYVAQIAAWLGGPAWAQAEVPLHGEATLLTVYPLLFGLAVVGLRLAARRKRLRLAPPTAGSARAPRRWSGAVAAAGLGVLAAAALGSAPGGAVGGRDPGLLVEILDVGQGNAALIEPSRGDPVLVDAGPADADVAAMLEQRGIDRLAALIVSHPDADHAGGAIGVLGSVPVRRLLYARADRALLAAAVASGARVDRVAEGAELREAGLAIDVLWPPRDSVATAAEPNAASLVVEVGWRGFEALLTGDAEAELAPIHPGHVDVLEVAHHGSEDAGLQDLVAEAAPELAVISVGAGNPYGHPAASTLATLRRARVPVARTDLAGEIAIEVSGRRWSVR